MEQGHSPAPPEHAPWMTAAQENAIVANVRRGMGLLSMHCSIWNPDNTKYMELLGVEKPVMHGPVQNVFLHNFNQDHPVTGGIDDFIMPLDENFGVELTNPRAVKLFESTGAQDKRHDIAGWALENGKGRVVGLVAVIPTPHGATRPTSSSTGAAHTGP